MPAMKSILIPSLFSLGALANAPTDYYTKCTTDNEYTVKKGEYCTAIAKHHGITVDDIRSLNPGLNWNCDLTPGKSLCLPAGVYETGTTEDGGAYVECTTGNTYTTIHGDSCYNIAKVWGITVADIHTYNPHLNSICALKVGESVCLPADAVKTGTYTVHAEPTYSTSYSKTADYPATTPYTAKYPQGTGYSSGGSYPHGYNGTYGGKPYGGKPYGGKPYGGKPYGGYPETETTCTEEEGSKPTYPAGSYPHGGYPHGGKPYGGKPYGGKPYGGKEEYPETTCTEEEGSKPTYPVGGYPHGGKPYGGKPYGGKPYGGKSYPETDTTCTEEESYPATSTYAPVYETTYPKGGKAYGAQTYGEKEYETTSTTCTEEESKPTYPAGYPASHDSYKAVVHVKATTMYTSAKPTYPAAHNATGTGAVYPSATYATAGAGRAVASLVVVLGAAAAAFMI